MAVPFLPFLDKRELESDAFAFDSLIMLLLYCLSTAANGGVVLLLMSMLRNAFFADSA